MEILSIRFSGSNPSVGPFNSKSTNTLYDLQKYPKEIESLLYDTKVNDVVSLKDYLSLRINNNSEELSKVYDAYQNKDLSLGGRILDLEFEIKEHGIIKLKDTRKYKLTGKGYDAFEKLIKEKGSVHISEPENFMKPEKESEERPFEKSNVEEALIPPPIKDDDFN